MGEGGIIMRIFSAPLRMAACAAALSAFADDVESVTAWADGTIAVDASVDGFRAAMSPCTLRCSPDWCTGGTNVAGASYSLSVVTGPDTANAVTTAVSVAEATQEDDVSYTGSGYVRFILKAEAEGAVVGSTLVQDVSFGVRSALSAAAAFDGREGALQEIADAGTATTLLYSSDWAEGAANLQISSVCVRHAKNGDLLDVTTNALYSSAAPASGERAYVPGRQPWGEYRLLLQQFAGDGTLLLEHLSPEFVIPHVIGTCFTIR